MSVPILIKLYRAVMTLLIPLWWLVGWMRIHRHKEEAQRLAEHWGKASHPRPHGPLIWFHAASIGEARALTGLMTYLLKAYPQVSILVTTQTISAFRALKDVWSPRIIHQMAPYDVPLYVRRFLAHWKPQVLCVYGEEIWPTLWTLAARHQVKLWAVDLHLSAESYHRWKKAPAIFRALYSLFEGCFTASATSAQYFSALTGQPIQRTLSLKYTLPIKPASPQAQEDLAHEVHQRPTWMVACTHPPEEPLFRQVHDYLKQRWPNLLTIWIPRHPDRIRETLFQGTQLQRRSAQSSIALQTDIYLVDTFGELGLFYAVMPFAVFGGSFCQVGGHSLIEPGRAGCVMIHGPDMRNNREIADDFKAYEAAVEVSAQKLAPLVESWIRNPRHYQERRVCLQHMWAEFDQRGTDLLNDLSQRFAPGLFP